MAMAISVGVETPNELMAVFSNTVSAGFSALQGPVNGVFGLMIALVVALTGIQWALSSNREVLASGFGKVLLIGAFAWLINDWQALSETIYAGFLELGLTAGGGDLSREDFLNPGAILAEGWRIVKALGETPAPVENPLDIAGNLTDALILGLAMIGIMLAFAVLALQIIVSLVEFKIVTLGGFILLPFGIWSKSAFLAERPLGYVVSSGLKVLALAIVVSGARTVFDQLQPSANPDIYDALTILVAAILLAMLAIFIPNLASALVTGGPALGAGALITGGLAVGGAGLLAGVGMVGAGGAAARLAGPARAASSAGAGRSTPPSGSGSPSSPSSPSPSSPPSSPALPRPGGPARASNDNPSPSGARSAPGGSGVSEAQRAWSPEAGPQGETSSAGEQGPASTSGKGHAGGEAGATGGLGPGRKPETIAREAEAARKDFHRAAAGGDAPARDRHQGRSAALQAFFVANAGRGLMPSGETSGVLSPSLKTEEP
ncbi:MAG: P-type conjugative transfer protein TrbL [Brevundimonas sp.]|jgi:type IV secretion system protein TrbL|uniref:P-type conjugative transfer protein TrbL n=1 Tax=Brevundimonas sp. TaxID=1871086 RepID=UPI0025C05195|nr:P-type conjugative transfer protein TrbL [Brevundimonas sp.]MCH4269645.1 P-type conjugative transfer protein TrbL [Brevundimonas sp.]